MGCVVGAAVVAASVDFSVVDGMFVYGNGQMSRHPLVQVAVLDSGDVAVDTASACLVGTACLPFLEHIPTDDSESRAALCELSHMLPLGWCKISSKVHFLLPHFSILL